MQLSSVHLDALANLHRKSRGGEVDWINIADARALVEFGLAVKTRQGWAITPAGEARLTQDASSPQKERASIAPLRSLRLVADTPPSNRRDE